MNRLTFAQLRATNAARCERWDHSGWSLADWSNAAAGEMGEACNVVKKIRRIEIGIKAAKDPDPQVLHVKLVEEIADTVLYLDLLALKAGIDLGEAVVTKFNAVSMREGFPERLTGAT